MKDSLRAICVEPVHTIRDVMQIISDAALHGAPTGIALVVDDQDRLEGVITDGDLRRAVEHEKLAEERMDQLMGKNPRTLTEETLLQEAIDIMHESKLDNLVVVDSKNRPVGIIDIQDLLQDGLI